MLQGLWYQTYLRDFDLSAGAQTSPLQGVPLADSCLSLGAQSCKRAREIIEDLSSMGSFGPRAQNIEVIYAQTDSLFVLVRGASVAEAICKQIC